MVPHLTKLPPALALLYATLPTTKPPSHSVLNVAAEQVKIMGSRATGPIRPTFLYFADAYLPVQGPSARGG